MKCKGGYKEVDRCGAWELTPPKERTDKLCCKEKAKFTSSRWRMWKFFKRGKAWYY